MGPYPEVYPIFLESPTFDPFSQKNSLALKHWLKDIEKYLRVHMNYLFYDLVWYTIDRYYGFLSISNR